MTYPVSVSCTALSSTFLQKARELCQKLGLPLVDFRAATTPYLLDYSDSGLSLHQLATGGSPGKPMHIDFTRGSTAYRHHRNCTIRQPIARAAGIKPGFRPTIFDATAGLGEDGFVFASLGCRVTMCERSPILWALLADGLARAAEEPGSIGEAVARIDLHLGSAHELLNTVSESPFTIYFDPMYPHPVKSALHKKEMRIVRDLVGDDMDAATVLDRLFSQAANRVVVKRPKGAERLGKRIPTHSINMKNSRFDVYLVPTCDTAPRP